MINIEQINQIIKDRKRMTPDDPRINRKWEELTILLSQNEKETIDFIKGCSSEQAEWISEVFEDISENLQSQGFIVAIEGLQKKFSNLDLATDISYAKMALEKN
ncbi:hypothetical protein [Listeria costaricensis]|uniref:hypothetical protein n=1 Tax=Listeria costaricensis TaxID=2026604 RepID=UPI000C06D28C|nr:hypothetical protein [Listeria costaricensis]